MTDFLKYGLFVAGVACAYLCLGLLEFGYLYDRSILCNEVDDEYDYVIVGGGSAGSVVASRLSENRDLKILLLEAGDFYDHSKMHIPRMWIDLIHSPYDWDYYTEPQKEAQFGLNDKKGVWPRGKVLGGSSAINLLQYTRGSPHDYDEWARNGCTGWSYKDVLPYFKKAEDMLVDELKPSQYHSSGGPLAVSGGKVSPIADLYMKAGEELGYKITDYNGEAQNGFSNIQVNVRKGVRSSTGVEYLGKRGRQPNLDIAINSFVTQIIIEQNTAKGVWYIRNGRKRSVKARKEVILSGGAINSPQILMLSGIGPKRHLEEMNIPVIKDLPVGQNLQDHQAVFLFSSINSPIGTPDSTITGWMSYIQYHLFGQGPLSIAGTDGSAFLHFDESKKDETYADVQMVFLSSFLPQDKADVFNFKSDIAREYLAKDSDEPGITSGVLLTHLKSRGSVTLRSQDPFDYPIIDPKYFSDVRDMQDLIKAVRLWENVMETSVMRNLGVDISQMKMSFCSQHEFRSDDYWECFLRHLTVTSYHPTCTCKMGALDDPTTVVDVNLRVKGIKGLRVVDASIFPNVTSGNTNAPTIMVAEKISDLILNNIKP